MYSLGADIREKGLSGRRYTIEGNGGGYHSTPTPHKIKTKRKKKKFRYYKF